MICEHRLDFINKLCKYADDTTLPEHTDVQLEDEFQALKHRAENNKMILNMLKTKELVFHRPSPCLNISPPLHKGGAPIGRGGHCPQA